MSAFDGEFNRWTQHYSAGALWRSAGTILRLSVNIAVVQVHERLFAAVFGDVESKHAIGAGRPFEHFREVFAQNVSVFVAAGPPVLQAARKAGGTVYAASLAHPGGKITGIFMDFPDFTAK
jgi:hypothetical protein